MKHYLGIDIGGTAVKLGIVDEAGAVLAKAEESVSFDGYCTPILTTVLKAAQAFLAAQNIPAESFAGIGVSATGQIDSRKGIVAGTCGNLPNYIGAPIKAELEKTFGLPVTVANDANCMTLGEVWVGGAKGYTDVIGGWFITAGAAFTICFFVALVLYFGGNISIIALIALAAFILIRSQVMYKKRKAKEQGNETLKQLMQTSDSEEALQLMRKHTREELCKVLEYAETNFELTVTSFIHENLRGLRRAMGSTKFEKQLVKQMKRTGTVAMCRLDNNTVLEKGLYYYQGNDFASELVYSISRLCEPCLEHIDNNFNPLDAIQKGEFSDVSEDITYLIQQCRKKMENNEYNDMEEEVRRANDLNGQLSLLKRKELQRIQSQAGSIRVSMVYLTMVQEAQNVVTYTINLMKVSRKFQVETEMP